MGKRKRLCDCCYSRPAVRFTEDAFGQVLLCRSCPDPVEILRRAAAIRDRWPAWRRRQAEEDERHGDAVEATPYTVSRRGRSLVAKPAG
jgi:hypothetical protein